MSDSNAFLFLACVVFTLFMLYRSMPQAGNIFSWIIFWIIFQGILGWMGFYWNTFTLPPRFILMPGPPALLFIFLLATQRGRQWMDTLHVDKLTLLHTVRIPVELVLFGLFIKGWIPKEMTFEGRNWDIFSGLTAPLVYLYFFKRRRMSGSLFLVWNLVCLGLLFIVVGHGILSAPSPFQQIAFDQPNKAILLFPYIWLPSVVVPAVLFAHLVSIRQWWVQRF